MEDLFPFTMREELEMAGRLIAAGVFGGALGYEREQADKPAGMRTLALVAMGAALFTLVSSMAFGQAAEPSRIAASIVTGIGFVGGGVIFRTGLTVVGVTTAATIWVSAAIGMATGAGMYILSVAATLLAVGVLRLLPKPNSRE